LVQKGRGKNPVLGLSLRLIRKTTYFRVGSTRLELVTSAMRRQGRGFIVFTGVQKPLQTARLYSSCTQANYPVLACIGVPMLYRNAPRGIVKQEVEGCKNEAGLKDSTIMSLTQRVPERPGLSKRPLLEFVLGH